MPSIWNASGDCADRDRGEKLLHRGLRRQHHLLERQVVERRIARRQARGLAASAPRSRNTTSAEASGSGATSTCRLAPSRVRTAPAQLVRSSPAVANSASRAQTGLGAHRSAQSAVISATPGPSSRSIGSSPQSPSNAELTKTSIPDASNTATASAIRSSVAWLSSSSERYLRSSWIAPEMSSNRNASAPCGCGRPVTRKIFPDGSCQLSSYVPSRAPSSSSPSLRRNEAKSFCSGICRVSRSRSRKSRRRRPPRQPHRVDLHEIGQRRVEEPEPPVLVEDREPDRQVRERLGQRLDEPPQARLRRHQVVGVEREAHRLARPPPGSRRARTSAARRRRAPAPPPAAGCRPRRARSAAPPPARARRRRRCDGPAGPPPARRSDRDRARSPTPPARPARGSRPAPAPGRARRAGTRAPRAARASAASASFSARASSLAGRIERCAAPPRGAPTISNAVPSPLGQWWRNPVP